MENNGEKTFVAGEGEGMNPMWLTLLLGMVGTSFGTVMPNPTEYNENDYLNELYKQFGLPKMAQEDIEAYKNFMLESSPLKECVNFLSIPEDEFWRLSDHLPSALKAFYRAKNNIIPVMTARIDELDNKMHELEVKYQSKATC